MDTNSRKPERLELNRRRFISVFSAAGVSVSLMPGALAAVAQDADKITPEMIEQAEKIAGLTFTPEERDELATRLHRFNESYDKIRNLNIDNTVSPALYFDPVPPGKTISMVKKPFSMSDVNAVMPADIEELAFYPVTHLAKLIETRKVSSTELTKMYISRLKKHDPVLHCVVSLTEELALKQAKRADQELAAGQYRGPLHGIPWGAKDLFAVKGYKTTWGAHPYKEQIIDTNAEIVTRLEDAGAVLVAKLTLGALAMGDNWFGGKTRNPWNTEQGSSGSSAGPGSATAAGLVGFSIGTETRGSIVSPSSRCGNSGLRPTSGRISKYGAMALSWSMDKVGPMCRSVEDCAIVFNYIYGPDPKDRSTNDYPFNWDPDIDITRFRVGYQQSILDSEPESDYRKTAKKSYKEALGVLKNLGVKLVPFEIPQFPSSSLNFILTTEAAAAFDELTYTKRDSELTSNSWARSFRQHRFVPGVEYIQANRARTMLMHEMDKLFDDIDMYVGSNLGITNLTGHPEVVIPNGFRDNGTPYPISFTGKLFGEAEILALAHKYQQATGHHLKRPKL